MRVLDVQGGRFRTVRGQQVLWFVNRSYAADGTQGLLTDEPSGLINSEELRALWQRHCVKAILAEFGPSATAVMDASQACGLPLVAHFHGYDAYERQTVHAEAIRYQRLFDVAAALVVASRAMSAQLVRLGADPSKIRYCPYGVDPALYEGRFSGDDDLLYLAVGRFVAKKGQQHTLRAFALTLRQLPRARLVMIGDGPLLSSCRALASELGIQTAVSFLGARNHVEVASWLRRADVLVQHSVRATDGDSEGTPLALLEAAAASIPVVSTRHTGIPEIVDHERTGLLVEEGDVATMAEQMSRLGQDAPLRARLGAAARTLVVERFDIARTIQSLAGIVLPPAARFLPVAERERSANSPGRPDAPARRPLKKLSVIIVVRVDSDDRLRNLEDVLACVAHHFCEYELIVIEHDRTSRLGKFLEAHPDCRHFHLFSAGRFHKTRALNFGVSVATRPFVLTLDTDILLHPDGVGEALASVAGGAASFVYPFNGVMVQIRRGGLGRGVVFDRHFFDALPTLALGEEPPPGASVETLYGEPGDPCSGGALMFRRVDYLRVGGYNENIVSYSCEDLELARRLRILGSGAAYLPHYNCYHLEHLRGEDSHYNAYHAANLRELQKVSGMDARELQQYVDNGFRRVVFDARAGLTIVDTPTTFSISFPSAGRHRLSNVFFLVGVGLGHESCEEQLDELLGVLADNFLEFLVVLVECGGSQYRRYYHRDNVIYTRCNVDESWIEKGLAMTDRDTVVVYDPARPMTAQHIGDVLLQEQRPRAAEPSAQAKLVVASRQSVERAVDRLRATRLRGLLEGARARNVYLQGQQQARDDQIASLQVANERLITQAAGLGRRLRDSEHTRAALEEELRIERLGRQTGKHSGRN
jgi:glycosyltransferase involved in cell wall biosynthesis